ncbi:MAG: NAD(+)/NADH kinase [Dehalococcoidia bacterium]|jgi:NAD+ kinase|nr:NAD(+)/NADH kinase [Dehalococcoidia bacterium]
MERVGICYHPGLEGAHALAERLAARASERGVDVWLAALSWEEVARELAEQTPGSDALICVGGDGTVLHASEVAAQAGTPLFGVRIGRLGFLCEVTEAEAEPAIDSVLSGEARRERRSMVQARLNKDEPVHALNDVVIGRRGVGHTISVGARINGELVAEYRGDAVIVATATGSTGYALSVGGPILHPSSADMVLIPVAPHLSRANALVLPAAAAVELEVARGFEAVMTVDGQVEQPVPDGAVVHVSRSPRSVDFLRLGEQDGFYSHLALRLGWLRPDHVLGAGEGGAGAAP